MDGKIIKRNNDEDRDDWKYVRCTCKGALNLNLFFTVDVMLWQVEYDLSCKLFPYILRQRKTTRMTTNFKAICLIFKLTEFNNIQKT